jgi:hypothetical protein
MLKTWHKGNGRTHQTYTVISDISAFILLWHQGLYPVTYITGVKCAQPRGESLIHADPCCTSLANQVLLKGSKGMEITGCKIQTAGMVVNKQHPSYGTLTVMVHLAMWHAIHFCICGVLYK